MSLSRKRKKILAAAVVALAVAATLSAVVTSGQSGGSTFVQPFADSSPFRTPIPDDVAVDPGSDAMIRAVTGDGNLHAALVEFGIPIFSADAQTPTYTVPCRATDWGPCPFDGRQIPIPDGARPHTGSDGAMVVVDESTRTSYEFWQAINSDGGWSTEFAAINDIDGSGWSGAATGSGASRLAGVIRIAEVQQGSISHALAMQTNNVCEGAPRPPALKSDGRSTSPDCLPEGARLQLDPSLDLDSLNLTAGERMVAVAMQRFGGYIVDVGGAPLSVSFEMDPASRSDFIGSAYQEAGFRWDYDGMTDIPWQRLRVVQ
ncbi:MAG: hypothetical protein ABW137_13865 [Mycobacterium sp.]